MLEERITSQIIKAFYKVYNTLGYGFLERVYERSLYFELIETGFQVVSQKPIKVFYNEKEVGEYFADLVVNDKVILEIKAAHSISKAHEIQIVNYLKATKIEVGLILNFGPSPNFQRKVFSNTHKPMIEALFDS